MKINILNAGDTVTRKDGCAGVVTSKSCRAKIAIAAVESNSIDDCMWYEIEFDDKVKYEGYMDTLKKILKE